MKEIYELLNYLWTFRKNKRGLFTAYFLVSGVYWTIIVKFLPNQALISQEGIFYYTTILLFVSLIWFLQSGRFIFPNNKFTVVFSIKPKGVQDNSYIQDAISKLQRELEILGLRDKIKIILAGQDFIERVKSAHKYRERFDIDLVIWGKVYSGTKEKQDVVCDFKDLFFTYKIPHQVINANVADLFKSDINISIVNRDWNIFGFNSIPDTEKISGHLTEIIMFTIGIIYCQSAEYAQESIIILEKLFKYLEKRTIGETPSKSSDGKTMTMSRDLLYQSRVLAILIKIYYNLGVHLMEQKKYPEARFYFRKYLDYEKEDGNALANIAYCAFEEENDICLAKKYTEKIGEVDKYNPFYLTNRAFFDIWEKNYHGALFHYMLFLRKGRPRDGGLVIKVIAFLDRMKKENKTEIGYDFAIGFMNYHFMDKGEGELELKGFLKIARGKEEYKEMATYVESTIVKKKKKKHKRKKA